MRPVARAVAAFNQDEGVPVPREHSRADQLAQVRRAARLVAWACPQVAAEVEALTAAVVDGLPEAAPGRCIGISRPITCSWTAIAWSSSTWIPWPWAIRSGTRRICTPILSAGWAWRR